MSSWVIIMMISVSTLLGAIALFAFMWAVKNGQFDDNHKMMNQVHFDDERELNDAADAQKKREALKKEQYRPE